jgi:hypothetical protein
MSGAFTFAGTPSSDELVSFAIQPAVGLYRLLIKLFNNVSAGLSMQ